jgi:hypothetical protein
MGRGGRGRATGATSVAGTPTFPEHLSPPPVFSGFRNALSSVFCVVFCISLFVLLAIAFSVLRFADCDYPFVIFQIAPLYKERPQKLLFKNTSK